MSAPQVVLTPKRGLVSKAKPKPSQNPPKKPTPKWAEIACLCCRRPFHSWSAKANRLCRSCKESA